MKSLDTKLDETAATPWDQWFDAMAEFRTTQGHALVPHGYTTSDGLGLWYWVEMLRRDRPLKKIPDDQIKKLDTLDFIWELQDPTWETGFAALQVYKAEHGDCIVPLGETTKGNYRLGLWVYDQRAFDGNYPKEKARRLSKLGFVWVLREYEWDQALKALVKYKDEHGDCLVPEGYKTEDNFDLGHWVTKQRTDLHYNFLEESKMLKLHDLGFEWADDDDQSLVLFLSRKKKDSDA